MKELFGDAYWIVNALYGERYQVEVQTFRSCVPNKYRLLRIDPDPSTPKYAYKKVLVGEFDDPQELVAVAKLILASETS